MDPTTQKPDLKRKLVVVGDGMNLVAVWYDISMTPSKAAVEKHVY